MSEQENPISDFEQAARFIEAAIKKIEWSSKEADLINTLNQAVGWLRCRGEGFTKD